MKKTKLLTQILKQTNELIMSDEYRLAYSLNNSFSRKRKLSFSNTVLFICSILRKSISLELDNFKEKYASLKFPNISKQGTISHLKHSKNYVGYL